MASGAHPVARFHWQMGGGGLSFCFDILGERLDIWDGGGREGRAGCLNVCV